MLNKEQGFFHFYLQQSLRSPDCLHQQVVMVELVHWWHPAGIEHNHLPAKVIITYRERDTHKHTAVNISGSVKQQPPDTHVKATVLRAVLDTVTCDVCPVLL